MLRQWYVASGTTKGVALFNFSWHAGVPLIVVVVSEAPDYTNYVGENL